MMETLRVCLSTADLPPFANGGLARYSSELYRALTDLGLEITLIAPVPIGGSVYSDARIASFRMPFYRNRILKYPIFNLLSLRSKLERKFDVIHSLGTQHEMGLSRIATNNLILTVHHTFAQQLLMPYSVPGVDRFLRRGFYSYMGLWERIACLYAEKVIAVSRGTKSSLVESYRIPSEKIDVIYSGVDLEKFHEKGQVGSTDGAADDYLLYVGRIVPRKGIEYALQALHSVRKERRNLQFVLVGKSEGSYKELLMRLARRLKIQDEVHFMGHVDDEDLPALYKNAFLVIFPSLVEGFGLACLEAMACGTPVIASDIPGVREVVIQEKTGLLVPPQNHVELSNAILRLAADAGMMKRLSQNGLQRAEMFSWPKTAHRVYACYRDLT